MNDLRLKPYMLRLYFGTLLLFILNKFMIRPFVLARELPEIFTVVVFSLPNACEAIMGLSCVAGILLYFKHRSSSGFGQISDGVVYLIALVLASAYVITQEFNLHHLGGENTYDPYDVVASVLGLLTTYLVISRFGIYESDRD